VFPFRTTATLVWAFDRTQDVLNIQPVIPFKLSEDWMVIARVIQPIVWQPYPVASTGGQYGLGDLNPTPPLPRLLLTNPLITI